MCRDRHIHGHPINDVFTKELLHLFLRVWNGAISEWSEERTSREIRAKRSVAGTDPDAGLQLPSFDPLSFIQWYNNIDHTSAFVVRLGTQNQTEVSQIMTKTFKILQHRNMGESCRTFAMDFSRHWSWPNWTGDESIVLNTFRETLILYLLKRGVVLSDYVVSCCMLEFCGNALTLWFQSQWSYSEGSSWVAEQHLTPYHHSPSGCQLSQQHATRVANGVWLITVLES